MKIKILLTLLAVLTVSIFSCRQDRIPCVRGKGAVVTQTKDLSGFTSVVLESEGTMHVMQGNNFSVQISGQQNVLDKIVADVEGTELHIFSKRCIGSNTTLDYFITMPVISGIALAGSGNVVTPDTIESDKLDVTISGSGDMSVLANANSIEAVIDGSGNIDLRGHCQSQSSTISGSGNIDLSGSTQTQDIIISGSGNVSSYSMPTHDCHVTVSGSGNTNVSVIDRLWIVISGSGNVYYKGDASIEEVTTSGSGNVVHE